MQKISYLSVLVCGLLLFSNLQSFSQDNCGGAVITAKALYEQGKIHETIAELKPCLTHSLDKTNLWQGYKLMALSYLALNDPDNARKSAEDMLELYPLYRVSLLNDPKDFINLINSITVIPKFSVGVSLAGGINNTYVNILKSYTISDYTKTYSSKPGYQFGVNLGYNINREISLGMSLFLSYKNYGISYATNNFDVNVNEKLSYLEIPVVATYTFGKGRLRPFITGGVFEGFLLSATSEFHSIYKPDGSELTDNNVPDNDRRTKTNLGLVGGIGFTYKTGPSGHFVVDFRYTYGMNSIINGANRYGDENLYFNYYYLDDDLSISNSLLTIGYVFYMNYKVLRGK